MRAGYPISPMPGEVQQPPSAQGPRSPPKQFQQANASIRAGYSTSPMPGQVQQPPAVYQPVIINNMQQAVHRSAPYEMVTSRDWSHGLFSCTDNLCFCVSAYCCPPLAIYELQDAHARASPRAASACAMCCFGNIVLQRHLIRRDRGIDGSLCGDCMVLCFCTPCALTQEYLEVTNPRRKSQAPVYDQY